MIEVALGVFLGHLFYSWYVNFRMNWKKRKKEKQEVGKGLTLNE